jgi:AcrR family transcriptional regulator
VDAAPVSAAMTARARARAELTREIKEAARRQLASEGAANLSLRAVARELGMSSSALYRYYPSRDDLLTALIIDAYDDMGAAAEAADAACARNDIAGRWFAIALAVRSWALANPHEYTLIYGAPVPGYRAPESTTAAGARVALALAAILRDAAALGPVSVAPWLPPLAPTLRMGASRLRELLFPGVSEEIITAGVLAWVNLFGAISFELFGHLQNVVDDGEAFFRHAMNTAGALVGFTDTTVRVDP